MVYILQAGSTCSAKTIIINEILGDKNAESGLLKLKLSSNVKTTVTPSKLVSKNPANHCVSGDTTRKTLMACNLAAKNFPLLVLGS